MSGRRHSSFITRQNRQLGHRCCAGDTSRTYSSLTSSIQAHRTWDPRKTLNDTDYGGVFNFGFSKNGSLLGVALERRSVLLFDPLNGKLVAKKTNAHTDCVNCVKFLDDRLFATCSDDTTVALWDTRYLKHNVQTFRGHSNWVKNIEYDSNQGILLTSGFDGCIYTWNINKYSTEDTSNRVFFTSGLMRSKLSPDFSKLIISTHEGYIIIVHNLDLSTLSEDLKGFKPNMYRLMQRSQTPLKIGLSYNHVFEQERNRVEFITDWPTGNEANIISSLQVHPQGWCILSRNTDATESTEWTCVHDLQTQGKVRKTSSRPWEVDRITPHTSSAFCTSTNTPAFSSQAPTRSAQADTSDNQIGRSRNRSGSTDSNRATVSDSGILSPTSRSNASEASTTSRTVNPTTSVSNISSNQSTENHASPARSPLRGQGDETVSGGRETVVGGDQPTSLQLEEHAPPNTSGLSNDSRNSEPGASASAHHTEAGNSLTTSPSSDNAKGLVASQGNASVTDTSPRSASGSNASPRNASGSNVSPRIASGSNASPRIASGSNASPRIASGSNASPCSVSGSNASPRSASGSNASPRSASGSNASPRSVSGSNASPRSVSGSNASPRSVSGSNASPRSASGSAISPAANRRFPVPESPSVTGSMHNSLIQIRRGMRQEDGSFSFSISVHTSSGRTILFNQNDLESDDEDNDIRIERIIPNPETSGQGNINTDNQESVSSTHDVSTNRTTTQNDSNNSNRNSSGVDAELDADPFRWDESDIENESDHDILEEGEYEFDDYDPSDHSDGEQLQEGNSFNIEIPGSSHDAGQFNVSVERNADSDEANEPMFRNTGASRIRRAGINQATRTSAHNSPSNASQSSAISGSVNTMMDGNSPRPSNSVNSRPRSNSFMFVLESNSGNRRRRVLNLSYLDTYTETENKLLQKSIHSNKNRLLGYVEECNVGKGFIKEVAFSHDGRLISSPFGFGIRLFSFDSQCNELCDCIPKSPVKLYEATCSLAHVNYVVATQFSPVHNLVVSGCLDGKIAFHQPVL